MRKLKCYSVIVNYRKNTKNCCDGGMIARFMFVWAHNKAEAKKEARDVVLLDDRTFKLPKNSYVVDEITLVNCHDFGFSSDLDMYLWYTGSDYI